MKSIKNRIASINTKMFTIVSSALFLFFYFSIYHEWANNFFIKLHFCTHYVCIIYSFIWLVLAIIGWQHLRNKKNIKTNLKTIAVVIFIVGIILMNITYCESGDMFLGNFSFAMFNVFQDDIHTECTPGVDCAGDIVEVPVPPCMESDDGRDYITHGQILSGVNLEDKCMGSDILRERYCDSELTYTSEDISCSAYMTDYFCLNGECVYSPDPEADEDTETNCGDGIDNDGDGFIDCADSDCDFPISEGGCGDFEYSCQHISPYPTCGGTCPTGEECIFYNVGDGTPDGGGWCECMPEEETACYDSIDCTGWCGNDGDYICIGDFYGCYCEWVFSIDGCIDTDGGIEPTIPGSVYYHPLSFIDYCSDSEWVMEYWCTDEGIGSQGEFSCIELFGENGTCVEGKFGGYCIDAVF